MSVSNTEDIIDSREVIERIEELESELQDAHEAQGNGGEFSTWLKNAADDDAHTLQDAAQELITLQVLANEAEAYASDWKHGEALIRDSYFMTYAEELADEIGAINKDQTWPNNCIDWDKAADELKQDYTEVDFDGVSYWIRAS